MISTELIGGPFDGRVVSIPEHVDEILFPNPISLFITHDDIINGYPMFTNSSYKSHANMDEMTIDYVYAGIKR